MKKYEAYKNPDIEWMEEIPVHWDVKSLKSTTDGNSSSFIDGDWIESPVITDDGIRYLTTGNVGVINYKEQGNGYISEQTFNDLKCSEVFPGDILISRLNLPLSRCCIVPELGKRIVTAVDNVIYRPDSQYHDKLYMVYLLNSARYAEFAGTLGRGTTMKRISRSALAAVKVCIPPLSEQQAIASYLDHRVGQIDASIFAINVQIDDLKAYRMSVISEAVTKGLNPDAPMKDSGLGWIGAIPEGWKILKMNFILSGLQDGTHGTFDRVDNGYPLLSAKNVFPSGIVFEEKESYISESDFKAIVSNGFPQKGDVALCCVGTVGRCCVYTYDYPIAFQRSVTFLRPNNKVQSYYLWYYLQSNKFQDQLGKYAKTSAQSGVYLGDLAKTIVILPPLSEQQAIATYLDYKTSKIDAAIASLESQRYDLNALKQSVISEAVTGKIDVRGWKLNNEQ